MTNKSYFMKIVILCFFLFLGSLVLTAQDTTEYRQGRLDNGLTYYIRHTGLQKGKADFYLVQNVGAMMEEDNQNGLAHFLEHMAFNGTENFPKGIQAFLKSRGVTQFNAYTGQDETVYHINRVPTNSNGLVDSCILILRDWSGFLLLDPVEIDKERGVILEERRLRQNVGSRLHDQTDRYIFNGSKYAVHNTIGLEEVIKNFTPAELRAYYTDFYRPDQQAVIIVGDIDAGRVEREVMRLFNPIPKRVNPKPRVVYEIPENTVPIYCKAFDKELPGNSILLIKRHRLAPPASLDEMMRNNLLSKFYSDIVRKYLSRYINDESPDFMETMVSVRKLVRNYQSLNIMVNPYPGKDREALQQLLEELERIRRFAFTPQELQEQISRYLEGLDETEKAQAHLSNDVYVQLYQNNFLEGNPVTTITEDIALSRKILAAMTVQDMQQWMSRWEGDANWVFVMQGNDPDYDFPTAEEISGILKDVRAKELTPKDNTLKVVPLLDFDVHGGKIVKESHLKKFGAEKWILSNGCTVYFKQVGLDKGVISLTGESPGGRSLLAVEDLPSAAALDRLMLRTGIYKHDARMFEEIMKNHKVSLNLRLGAVTEDVRCGCDSTDVEMMFQLVYLALAHPRFDREDFEKFVYQSKMEYERTPKTVMDSVGEAVRKLRLTESPRRWKEDDRFFDAMDYDKMVAVFKDRFGDASDFTFYLTGDISREEAFRLAGQYLGALPASGRKEKAVNYDFLRRGSFKEDIVADLPDEKYLVNIEFHNYRRLNQMEQLALDMLQRILKDRYMAEIREEHGGAYGIDVTSSYMEQGEPHVSLGVYFQSSLDKGPMMRDLVHSQIRTVIDKGVEQEEMDDLILLLKKSVSGDSGPGGNSYWTNVLYSYVTKGKDMTRANEELKKIADRIGVKDVQALARKFFPTADCFDFVIRPAK